MEKVISYPEFLIKASRTEKFFLLLHKPGSEQSDCALSNLENAVSGHKEDMICTADVTTVKDIHTVYGITAVPALLVFVNGELRNIIKGCQEKNYYKALIENSLFRAKTNSPEKAGKRVTVYSTPTCSWCNTLKAWLKKNNISYSDIDVSRDQNAAEALVKRSGQQGVPQTEINGQIVVGFDQRKLKELLEIQ
jgi:glutaredoxin-like YruB-family protein